MISSQKEKILSSNDMWIISMGKYDISDFSKILGGINSGMVKEYLISDLARYMLSPDPIETEERLIGCDIHYLPSISSKIKSKIRQLLPKKIHNILKNKIIPPEKLTSSFLLKTPAFKNENFKSHFKRINELLKPFDLTIKRLSELDVTQIFDIVGICEDKGGNRFRLNVKGTIEEKRSYMINSMLKEVRVDLKKAYLSNGLFDMRGYDFQSYQPSKSYRLIEFTHDGQTKCCVLDNNNEVDFWIDDIELVHFMNLLDRSIDANTKLKDSLKLCITDNATPLKIFFNKNLSINYAKIRPPEIYREVLSSYEVGSDARNTVTNSINNLQFGISFNFIPKFNSGDERLFTSISVMHDFKALEPIKHRMPDLYSKIKERIQASDADEFYLLDSIRGYENGQ